MSFVRSAVLRRGGKITRLLVPQSPLSPEPVIPGFMLRSYTTGKWRPRPFVKDEVLLRFLRREVERWAKDRPRSAGEEDPRNNFFQNLSAFITRRASVLDTALSAVVGLGMILLGGVVYVSWYKRNVLEKIELAFEPGYNFPWLELVNNSKDRAVILASAASNEGDVPWTQDIWREEQKVIDSILQGGETGHYYVLLGPKGVGKTSMVLNAMRGINADGVVICDVHPDLEVFRLRLGKALNYEYNEDSQTAVFQRRDPREGGSALDIERALNKLEEVALRMVKKRRRPLVLIFNNVHYLNNDEEGRNILLQLQTRAEPWAASGLVTMVFSTDDFWPYNFLRKAASRMHVLSIYDLDQREALKACKRMRSDANLPALPDDTLRSVLETTGGRLTYLSKVAKHEDPGVHAAHLLAVEKTWLLGQFALVPDHDADSAEEQKWNSSSWLLLREFVDLWKEEERLRAEQIEAGDKAAQKEALDLPKIPYWRCRQIMTKLDYLEQLDRLNIISIDVWNDVRPDSMLILQAAREICDSEDFGETLEAVRKRMDELEKLQRS